MVQDDKPVGPEVAPHGAVHVIARQFGEGENKGTFCAALAQVQYLTT